MSNQPTNKRDSAMSSPVVRSRNVLKRNALRFAAALLAALAIFVAGPNAALAQAPQHHDQVPGFYRQKVGDLEVTALFDGHGVFDPLCRRSPGSAGQLCRRSGNADDDPEGTI